VSERLKSSAYDLIGDIHGYAGKLEALLRELGYRKQGGAYAHPERKAVFLGDLVDRGPRILDTIRIVRAMVDKGAASMVMGNHEFNALAWNTSDGNGAHLRQHSEKNLRQHQATLEQVAIPHPREWADHLDWFSRLPLALDFADFRAVHAAWDAKAVTLFRDWDQLGPAELAAMSEPGTPERVHREILINGLEINLPDGYHFQRGDGHRGKAIRTRWWDDWAEKSYRQIIFPDSVQAPDLPLSEETLRQGLGKYQASEPPVFFGHYWLNAGSRPEPLASNVACLDYSVAKENGPLTAYRFNGEKALRSENFLQV